MNRNRYFFVLGFISAILLVILTIKWVEPLTAAGCIPGSAEWCPMYVKVVQ